MKTLLLFLASAAIGFGAVAADNIILTQQKSDNSGSITRYLAPVAGGLSGFDGSKLPTSYAASVLGLGLANATDAAAGRSLLGLGSLATQSGTFSGTSSGTNSGDQTITLTGDATGSGTGSFAVTLATVNGSPNTFGSATAVAVVAVNAKGLSTTVSNTTIAIPATAISDSTTVGRAVMVATDAAAARAAIGAGTGAGSSNLTITGTPLSGQIAEFTSASDVQGKAVTGSGNIVLATSATLVTPLLGTPTSGNLSATTGYPLGNLTGAGAGFLTFGATPSITNFNSMLTGATVLSNLTKADVLEAALFAADAGANDTYAVTLSPAITAYVTGAHYRFKANTANTGTASLNINAVGAKTIVKVAGGITTTLADNDILAGQWVDVVYDGTNLQMQSLLGNAANPMTTAGDSIYGGASGVATRLAVGAAGAVYSSSGSAPFWNPPGASGEAYAWTKQASSTSQNYYASCYGNGLFVVGANAAAGTTRIITSPDGINWTTRTSPGGSGDAVTGLCYANGLFVGVGASTIITSPDGITWTARSTVNGNTFRSVCWGSGVFVAVSSDGSAAGSVISSPDGITWTSRTASQNNQWYGVGYGNGLFVAVAVSGTNRVMTSPDGITWTNRTAAAANAWHQVCYGLGLFVACSDNGSANRIMTSPDGTTWTSRTTPSQIYNAIAYGNGVFIAPTQDTGPGNIRSVDGITWTAVTACANSRSWQTICYGNGVWVSAADGDTGSPTGRIQSSGYTSQKFPENTNAGLFSSPLLTSDTTVSSSTTTGALRSAGGLGVVGAAYVGGVLNVAGAVTVSQTAGIVGTTTNNDANALSVGQYVNSLVALGAPVSLTTTTAANVTSISLTAGDWDVEGIVNFSYGSATATGAFAGISSTSATLPTDGSEGYAGLQLIATSATDSITIPRKRFSLSGTTTVYLVGEAIFSAGTVGQFGTINARRVR